MPTDTWTAADVRRAEEGPPPMWGRRLGTSLLLIIVLLGAVGVLGVHSRTITTSGSGWRMSVTYPQTARAGLDVPWRVRVHHPGGLPDKLTLAVSADYFRMFETQGFFPDADSETNDGKYVYFTFDTSAGSDDFLVDYDAYIQPSAQIGKSGTVELIIGKSVVAKASLHTWLAP
jgi:hypothetical protein